MSFSQKSCKRSCRFAALALSLAALALLLLIGLLFSARQRSSHISESSFPVRINEIMSSNVRYGNADGVFCDWVELYNSSSADIDISNYKLTDKSNEARYTIPSGTILPSGAYYVVYCLPDAQSPAYADFGISSKGHETIILMNRRNALVDLADTVALRDNQVMARDADGGWSVLDYATPGYENSEAGYLAYAAARMDTAGGAVISEVVAGNSFYYNADGVACDYVEIHNTTDAPLRLAGYMLTDNAQDIRFVFDADAVLPADGYLAVWCTRTPAQRVGTERYADFSVSRSGGEELLLLNADMQTVDRFLTIPVNKNAALVRGGDGVVVQSGFATPGFPNTPQGYADYLRTRFAGMGSLYISEIATQNTGCPDAAGRLYDWIELHNRGSAPVDLSGYGLSDRPGSVRYAFPAGTILEPDGYFVIYCSAEAGTADTTAPFGLSADGGETVILTDDSGVCVDAVTTLAVPANQSMARQADGTLQANALATPGYANTADGRAAYEGDVSDEPTSLRISEWMSSNEATIADGHGRFPDWVELVNTGDTPIDLNRFYLTDDPNDRFQFRLPERTLAPGAYVIVFCSGLEMTTAGEEIHAPFRLSAAEETIGLYSAYGTLVQAVSGTAPGQDRSLVAESDGTCRATAYPTPGFPNTADGYAQRMASLPAPASLMINEAAPSNRSSLRQRGGVYYDWVELKNGSGQSIDIGGYRLTTDSNDASGCVLPAVTLAPGETFLVLCSGDASLHTTTENACHAALSLNAVEDRLFLYNPNGVLQDYMRLYDIPADGSMGRLPDRSGFYLLDKPSPGAENAAGTALREPSAKPTSNTVDGVYQGVDHVDVSLAAAGDIYYTLDGSLPTTASARYTKPIRVTKTQVIRAVSYEADRAPSDALTLSYILNEGHTLPVVSLVADPRDLFDRTTGIYSNPMEDWERPASVSFFDGAQGFHIDCGVRISGQTSRGREHKSFKLLFEPKYGGRLAYPLYDSYPVNVFSSLLLRAGLDAKYAVIREPFFTQLAMPYKENTLVQNSRMAVVYLNGEYYGLYIVMEAYSEDFYADYFEVSPDSVTIIKGYLYDKDLEIYQLLQFASENDMTAEENYRYLEERVDFDSLIDYVIFQAYVHNADISGNVRYIKCSEKENKWQFALYDIECGMAFSMKRNHAAFDYVYDHGQIRMIFVPLLENAAFRDRFLQRLAYHCRVTFQRENVLRVFEPLVEAVEGEIPRNTARWEYHPSSFPNNIKRIRTRIVDYDRPMELISDISDRLALTEAEQERYFGDLLHE